MSIPNFFFFFRFQSFQEKFAKHVALLTTEFNKLGNIFQIKESKELVQLGTKEVMTDNVISRVRNKLKKLEENSMLSSEKLEYSAKASAWIT